MTIQVNGEARTCSEPFSLTDLIIDLGFKGQPVLVELNGEPIHVRDHGTTQLKDGDSIEIVRIVAGG